jgi:hypothetical protein
MCRSKRNQLGEFYAWNACLSHILSLAKVGAVLQRPVACLVGVHAVCLVSLRQGHMRA